MKLGILVNTDRHLDDVIGITQAAIAKNHSVTIFAMDVGTQSLLNNAFVNLVKLTSVAVSVCEHSAKEHGVSTKGLPNDISRGSQFNNAMMEHEADRVIVL